MRIQDIPTIRTRLNVTDVLAGDPALPSTDPTDRIPLELIWGENVVPVYEASDFGTDTGGGYQLTAFKHYVLMKEITLTKGLLKPSNGPVVLSSSSWVANSLECTGIFDLIGGSSAFGIYIYNIVANCTDNNTTIFNITSTGAVGVEFVVSAGICSFAGFKGIGRIEGFNRVELQSMNFNGFDDGLTIDDNDVFFGNVLVFESGQSGTTDVVIEGTSETVVFNECRHSNQTNAYAYLIDGASNVDDGKIINCDWKANTGSEFTDPLGLDRTDPNWELIDNGAAEDSRNVALAYLTSSETVTVSASNTFYEVGGVNFTSKIAERFSVSNSGVITYDGIRPIEVYVSAVATIEKTGGGSDELEGRIAKNWSAADSGEVDSAARTDNNSPTSIPIQTLLRLENGDNVRTIFANNDGTSNIIVDISNIIIEET